MSHIIKRERTLSPGEDGYCNPRRCDQKCFMANHCLGGYNKIVEEVEVNDLEFNSNPAVS